MRFALPLFLTALLAACGSPEPTVLENEAARAEAVKDLKGWDRVFGAPAETIGHANQFGFRVGDYAQDGATYLAQGAAVPLSAPDAESPNVARFEAAGAAADQIDRIVFTLTLADAANAEAAKERFATLIRDFLSQRGISDQGALAPILAAESADAAIGGTPVAIATASTGDRPTITVTFTRPAASTPGTQPAQGQ